MPEPAFLMLMQHLQRPPPAIIASVPAEINKRTPAAFAAFVQKQIEFVRDMTESGKVLRTKIWAAVEAGTSDITAEQADDLVESNDEGLVAEARNVRRLEKEARFVDEYLTDGDRIIIDAAHRALIDAVRDAYYDRIDFGVFLRAVRSEITQKEGSPSTPIFDDAEDLRRFLMK